SAGTCHRAHAVHGRLGVRTRRDHEGRSSRWQTKGDRHIEVHDTFTVTDSIQLGIRDYVSLSHIWSACYFARSAGSFEHADDGLPSRFEHISHTSLQRSEPP